MFGLVEFKHGVYTLETSTPGVYTKPLIETRDRDAFVAAYRLLRNATSASAEDMARAAEGFRGTAAYPEYRAKTLESKACTR